MLFKPIQIMPLGLRRGKVPEWYNLDWFKEHFEKYFRLLNMISSEKDNSRILLIGEKK